MKLKLMIAAIGAALCLSANINTAEAQYARGGVSVRTPNGSVNVRVGDPYYGNGGRNYGRGYSRGYYAGRHYGYRGGYRDYGYRRSHYRRHHRFHGHRWDRYNDRYNNGYNHRGRGGYNRYYR